MIERRKTPRAQNAKAFKRTGPLADRPRNVDVQGCQGLEQSAAVAGGPSRWSVGRVLMVVAGAPTISDVRNANTGAYFRIGILVASLAALVVSTKVIVAAVDVRDAVGQLRAWKADTIEIRRRHAEKYASSNYKVALNQVCVRPEVYRAISDRSRYIWSLLDKHDRIVEQSTISYISRGEAHNAADVAAAQQTCNPPVTETKGRQNL